MSACLLPRLDRRCIEMDSGTGMLNPTATRGAPAVVDNVVSPEDVKEQGRVQDSLHDDERRYRMLFERNPLPMWVADAETRRFLAVNEATVAHYGYTEAEFLAMRSDDIRPPEDRASFVPLFSAAGGCRPSGTFRHLRKDGTVMDVEITADDVHFAGRPAKLVLANDITERLVAAAERERLLRQVDDERTRLEALLRQLPVGVVLAEAPSGRLVKGNDHFERIFGHPFRPADNVSAYDGWVGFHEDGCRVAPHEWPLARAMTTGEEVHGEVYRYPRPDDPDAWIRLSASAVRDSSGRIVGGVVAAEDVTAQRAMAAALRASEEQLRQAQKMEAIGRLAGGVAHDFNNLLTVIISYTSMLLADRSPEDPTSADLREVLAASQRAASLTGQLLAFSRRQVLSPSVVDVAEVVGDMERMLRRLIGEDVDLTVAVDGTPAHTLADRGQLEQVVMNLAVNARDAMPQGGHLAIEIGVVALTDRDLERHPYAVAGEYVRVRVRDTGVGMDAETLSQVFEPFFTTKEVGKGTGLGLATVYGIVKQSGGYVWAESAPGEGTSFDVHLPHVADAPADPSEGMDDVAPCPRTGATVLVVEDEDALRAIVARVLRKRGYTVVVASDGIEALAAAERHGGPIDLLVTDVVMPKMSGQVLAERLVERHGQIPVLFISGYSMDAVSKHGVLRPGAPLLQKPFTPSDIALAVSELLLRSAPMRGEHTDGPHDGHLDGGGSARGPTAARQPVEHEVPLLG